MANTRTSHSLANRPGLTREKILHKALALADKNGLDSVSMRQLAQGLGVEAMSLYKHVSNKDDLLDGLAELVAFQMSLPSLEIGWKEALRERAFSERKALNQHPWAVTLFEARTGTGATRLFHQNHMIGILRKSGFSIELAFNALIAQTSYVYGFVILEHTWSSHAKENPKRTQTPTATISEVDHPFVFEMVSFAMEKNKKASELEGRPVSGHSADFDFGLNLILDGLERKRLKS